MENLEKESNESGERIKKKVKEWLKDPYNLILIVILIFSFVLLLYYFNLTKAQPLWWDEAEYMSTAKHWAFNTFEYLNPQRPPLFSFLVYLLYSLGLGESSIKFLLVLLPTWLVVFFIYFLIKEMYDKKIALIVTFITSVSWIHIFYAMRFMTDALGFLFGILAFLFFWKGYIKEKGKIYIWLIGFFVALSFMSRLTGILYGLFLVLFLILTGQLNFLKNKNVWISLFIFILMIAPYLFWSYNTFGSPLAFRSGYGGITYENLGWGMLRFVYDYPELIFFIFFLVGLITLVPLFLSLDLMFIKKDKKFYNNFFMFLSIIFTLAFFIYFLRQAENRWLIMMSIGIFTFSAKGILLVYDLIRKNLGKVLSISLLILILILGAYFQIKHTDMIIKNKIDSYAPVKEAALWMKENSQPGEAVLSVSYTQTIFYSERKVYTFALMNESAFEELLDKTKPKYMMVSVLEPHHPEWSYNMSEKYQKFLKPVQAWFADQEQKQPILIVYEVQ